LPFDRCVHRTKFIRSLWLIIVKTAVQSKKTGDLDMAKLVCKKCGQEVAVPAHCGKEMHLEGNQLVCWMGPECGHQPIPKHHSAPMVYKA